MKTITPNTIKFPVPGLRRSNPKEHLLHFAQQFLYLSGMASVYSRFKNSSGALILMYHSIVDDSLSSYIDPNNSITTDEFEAHLQYLKKHCNVIRFSTLINLLRNQEPIPENSVIISFDDGYRNNLTHAMPLLKKYDMPAILFLCTGYIDRSEAQWIDQLYTYFCFRTRHQLNIPDDNSKYDLQDGSAVQQAYREVSIKLLTAGMQLRKELLEHVKDQLQPSVTVPRLTLNWDEVRQLTEQYPAFELGLHTRDHLDLTSLERDEIQTEIDLCKADFNRELGYSADYFSYPYGRCNNNVREVIMESGFKGAVGTQPTTVNTSSANLYTLSRLEAPTSMLDFRLWMTGAMPGLPAKLFKRVYQ